MQKGLVFEVPGGTTHGALLGMHMRNPFEESLVFGCPSPPIQHSGQLQKLLLQTLRTDHSHVHCHLATEQQSMPLWSLDAQITSLATHCTLWSSHPPPSLHLKNIFAPRLLAAPSSTCSSARLPPRRACPWWTSPHQVPNHSLSKKGESDTDSFLLAAAAICRQQPILNSILTPALTHFSEKCDLAWRWQTSHHNFVLLAFSSAPSFFVRLVKSTRNVSTLSARPTFCLLHSRSVASRYLQDAMILLFASFPPFATDNIRPFSFLSTVTSSNYLFCSSRQAVLSSTKSFNIIDGETLNT